MFIEYIVEYLAVGLLWSSFLRVRYRAVCHGMRLRNWIVCVIFWPLAMLVFLQGCLFGTSEK